MFKRLLAWLGIVQDRDEQVAYFCHYYADIITSDRSDEVKRRELAVFWGELQDKPELHQLVRRALFQGGER